MEIFGNGLLKNEFINHNYRGLVGWKIDYEYDLIAVRNRRAMYVNANDDLHNTVTDTVNIKQFSLKDIPMGELCWFKETGEHASGDWALMTREQALVLEYDEYQTCKGWNREAYSESKYCVPYLIADTPERAEELKDWNL